MGQPPKTLWVKRPFLQAILQGRKTIEVRVGYRNIRALKPGMRLLLNDVYEVRIRAIRAYPSFQALLEREDPDRIVPGKPKHLVLDILRKHYPAYQEKLGVVAIELEVPRPERPPQPSE
jgi:ASC-1-like (ASCH) protein